MSAFVIAVAIPLLPVFGAITVTEAVINARKKGSSFKEELSNILNENDSDLIEQFHLETKLILKQEIENFINELTASNIPKKTINSYKEELSEILNEWDKILEIKLLKKDKIITIYDITLSELRIMGEEKFLELKEAINEIKSEILSQKSKEEHITTNAKTNQYIITPSAPKENFKENIKDYYNKLITIDESFKNKYQPLINNLNDFSSQRAKLILDEIKLVYSKRKKQLTKTQIYKEELTKLYSKTNNEIYKKEIDHLLKQKIVSKKEYENLFLKVTKENMFNEKMNEKKKLLAQHLSEMLKETNYTLIQNESEFVSNLINNKRIILPIKDKDYKVVIQLNKNNELLTRFVKVIDSDKNISTSEKLQDKSELKKWCNIQKKVYEKLKKDFIIDIQIIEDYESDVLYIADNEKTDKTVRKETNGQNSFRN